MRKRIQLEASNEPRRIRDIIQKADELRRDSAYQEPGGSYGGGSGNLSDYSAYGPDDGGFGPYMPHCWSKKQLMAQLSLDINGNYAPPEGFNLQEAYFDGINATGKYTTNEDGSITPLGNLVEGTEITGLGY